MPVLSDTSIKRQLEMGNLIIEPLPNLKEALQPTSIDLRIDNFYKRMVEPAIEVELGKTDMRTIWTEFQAHDFIYLDPYEFILGQTMEKVEIPYHLVARIEGRSSIGRQGISIHQTAGYIDAGFKGKITLEIFNATRFRQKIPVGMRFCQLVVETLTKPAQRPYGHRSLNSKYQYQVKPEPSRIVEDFDDFEKTKIINTIDNINDSNYL